MIGISKLYCGTVEPSDALRYGRKSKDLPSHLLQFSEDKKPVVVWNCTKACNLKCLHCYSSSDCNPADNELTTIEAKTMIDDLAAFGAPVLLFSGGEPLLRNDLDELIAYAVSRGMRAVISTNGTLLTEDRVRRFKDAKLSYIGISLDGMRQVHDRFRGVDGAFERTLAGIRNCIAAGIKVGIRFTIHKGNFREIPALFEFLEREGIPRICLYHLVYAGRGDALRDEELSHQETRDALNEIIRLTGSLHERGKPVEVLTVDNHCDGPYLYLKMEEEGNPLAHNALELLQFNQGNSSGRGIGCVSWDGEVYADQFWRHYSFGNVRKRPFSEIWTDTDEPLMGKLKRKSEYVTGRCALCKWLPVCGGNFRVRAEAVTGDLWAPDPACYLTDEEIGLHETKPGDKDV